NDGRGGFFDPSAALTTSTSSGLKINDRPGATVAADFNRDGNLDLAILMEDRAEVWVFLGQGGTFYFNRLPTFARTTPTGMTPLEDTETGGLALLIGNPYGDILRLRGSGDEMGSFAPVPPFAGNRTSLSLLGRDSNGRLRVLVGNQQASQVTVQAPAGAGQFTAAATLSDRPSPLPPAPDAVRSVKLDGPTDPYSNATNQPN